MSAYQAAIAVMVLLAIPLVLFGLVVRRRYDVAYTFTLYLAVVFVTELLIVAWPGTFYRKVFYLHKENAINALRFGVALELMYRTFRSFPSAHKTARSVVLVLLVITLGMVLAVTGEQPDANTLVNKVQPRVISATVWLLTALAGLILWYRLPVETFHKAILIGWVPYLLVFSAALNYVGDYGPQFLDASNYVHTIAFLGLLVYWARAAWAPAGVRVRAEKPSVALQSSAG